MDAPPDAAPAALRIVDRLAPEVALGRACAQLMSRPAFARAPFGHVARSLAGQVNRGHYAFVEAGGRSVGFAGWALVSESVAEAWLAGDRGFSDLEARGGDCVVLNFWQADDPAASRLLLAHVAAAVGAARAVYARRHYPDGRIRPVRLGLAAAQPNGIPIS